MRKLIFRIAVLSVIYMIIFSCNSSDTPTNKDSNENNTENIAKTNDAAILSGEYCFLEADNRDTTKVKLIVISDAVRGEMNWRPWEKDGANGTLSGKMISSNEMELLYDYVIEGNRQTETKIMKIENGKLFIKKGSLVDPKNDGNLVYKDKDAAAYTEMIEPVTCW